MLNLVLKNILRTAVCCICLYISASPVQAQLTYHLGGRLFLDGGIYTNAGPEFNSGVGITDVRLCGKAGWGDHWKVKLDVGFARNKVSLKDAFVQYHKQQHIFRAGHMMGMFSLDQSSSSNDGLFLTVANVAGTFYPGRRVGVSYTYAAPKVYASTGVFCGDGLNSDPKVSQGVNATGRLVYRPFHEEGKLLHIGSGAFFKKPDRIQELGRTIELSNTGNTSLPAPDVFSVVLDNVGQQWQWNVESIVQYNRFFMQAEYMRMWVNRQTEPTYSAHGGYVQCGWVLRGRTLAYDMDDALQVCAPGEHSVLVFGRFNCTDLNSNALMGGKMYDVSAGMNYYPFKYLILRVNYSHQWTDTYCAIGKQQWGMLQTRVQVKF